MSIPSSSPSPAPGPSTHRTGTTEPKPFAGHNGRILAVCYSPDGKQIVTGGWDPPIRTWDSSTGDMLLEPKGHADKVHSLCYSPDGKRLVGGHLDGGVCIWDVSDGELILERVRVHAYGVYAIAYSPDNQHIASGGNDCKTRIWRAEDLTHSIEIRHPGSVQSLNFSPDGSRLATGCSDYKVRVFDVTTGALVVGPLEGHTGWVNAVTYSPNGEQLASCSSDATIRTWDASTGSTLLDPMEDHIGIVQCVVYSPDGKQLLSGSEDTTVRCWESHTGSPVGGPARGHDGAVQAVSFAPDGTRFVTGASDGSIRVWDASTREVLLPQLTEDEKEAYHLTGPFRGHLGPIWAVAYFPDGDRIASVSVDCTIRIWDVSKGEEVLELLQRRGHAGGGSIAISSDGARLTNGGRDGMVRVWDTRTGEVVLGPLKGHAGPAFCIKFSPDDQLIASAEVSGEFLLWDSETGKRLGTHRGTITTLSFSADGSQVAVGGHDKCVYIWDVSTLEIAAGPFRGHDDWVMSVAFSPDGYHIVSGSRDKTVRVWDAKTGTTVLGPLEAHSKDVTSVSYSPDGTRICSTSNDGTICMWHPTTGDLLLGPLQGHKGAILSAAFSPDGKRIVTGSSDCTIKFWDTATGKMIQFPDTHNAQSTLSFLDLPATGAPRQILQTQHIQEMALGSMFDLPAVTHPQEFLDAVAGPVHDNRVVRSPFFSLSRLRNAVVNVFYNTRPRSNATELQERSHRMTSRPIGTAYAGMNTFVAVVSPNSSPPRQQALRDESDDETASGGSARQRARDGENVASNAAETSGSQPAEAATGEAAQHTQPPSMERSTPYAAPGPSGVPPIRFVPGSIESDESFERDCCECCPKWCTCLHP